MEKKKKRTGIDNEEEQEEEEAAKMEMGGSPKEKKMRLLSDLSSSFDWSMKCSASRLVRNSGISNSNSGGARTMEPRVERKTNKP